jgi:AraC family transcriptional regulator
MYLREGKMADGSISSSWSARHTWDSVTVVRTEHAPASREVCANSGANTLSVVLLPVERAEWRFENGETRRTKIFPLTTAIRGARDVICCRWSQVCKAIHIGINPILLARVAGEEVGVGVSLEPRVGLHDQTILNAALLLSNEMDNGDHLGSNLLVQSIANVLTVHLLRHYSSTGVQLHGLPRVQLDGFRLKRALDFIESNLGQSFTLEALAQAAGISPYHFARSFKHATGYSPHQWVMTQLINQAKILLRTTRLPIAEVARQVGMANHSHFANQFRKLVGVGPSEFRTSD